MDELENQAFPAKPEDMEEQIPQESAAAAEDVPALPEEIPSEEILPREAPAARQMPVQPPRRHSPYEHSPYMMPHQPDCQVPPAAEAASGPEAKPKKPRKKHPVLRAILQVAVFATLALASAQLVSCVSDHRYELKIQALEDRIEVLQQQLENRQNAASGESISGTPNVNPDGGMTPGQVYVQNEQSVVLIETDMATGSGFILTEDGYVVTNYHVVEDGTAVTVVLPDRTSHPAELVGHEANNDIALLKMAGEGFPAVTLGSSDALIVGDQVVAIGNPLGELTSTLTVGFVSAKARDVSTDNSVISMLQTDCAINSGNSGGPLFNMKGEVVGITSAKYSGLSASGASIEGIGFAIPIDDAAVILQDLMEFGYVKSAYLGVSVYTREPEGDLPLGCLVESVTYGGCAAAAGVLPGDVIVDVGGHRIQRYTDLARALREFEGGEDTTITVYRQGQGELTMSIILDAKPREGIPQTGENPMPENGSYEEWYEYFFGE